MIKISANQTIYNILKNHPDLQEVLFSFGFHEIVKPAMMQTAGRVISLNQGTIIKNINICTLHSKLKQYGYELTDIKAKEETQMNHFNLKDLDTFLNKRGVQTKTVVNHKNTTIKNLILKPHESIDPHQVGVDVTFFVLEGKGKIAIGETTYTVSKNDVVLCPPNTKMAVNASEVGLSFLNIKTPGI